MKMDKELIKDLLLAIERGQRFGLITNQKDIYHIELLYQAGWILYDSYFAADDGRAYESLRLTWKGSAVADIFRQGWDSIKGTSLINYPFEIIIDYLKKCIESEVTPPVV